MKRNYSFLLYLLLFVLTVTADNGGQSDTLTLADAIKIVLNNSTSVRVTHDYENIVSAKTNVERSGYYPSLTGTASYTNVGPVTKFSLPLTIPPSTTPVMKEFQLSPDNAYDIHAGFDYTIYDFGKRDKGVTIGKAVEEGASLKSYAMKTGIAYQTAVLFSSMLIQQQAIIEKEADSATLQKHIDFVNHKLETGSATQFDVLRAKVQLTTTKTELNNIINEFAKTKIEFQQLAGFDESKPINLKGYFDSSFQKVSEDSIILSATNERPDLKGILISKKAITLQRDLMKIDMAPVLAAKGTAGYKNGYSPEINKPEFNWTAGVSVQVPIFNGYKSSYRFKEAQSRLDSIQHVYDDTKRKVRIEILKAIQDLNAAHDNLQIAMENEQFAGEAFHLATLQYETGSVTNLDVLDAETKYSQAKFVRLQSEYRCTMCKYALWQSAGYDFTKLAE